MKRVFPRFRKMVSSTLLVAFLFSIISPLDRSIVFAGNPGTPAFVTNIVQANVPASGPTTARGVNIISFSDQPNDGKTITIGGTTYRFVNSL